MSMTKRYIVFLLVAVLCVSVFFLANIHIVRIISALCFLLSVFVFTNVTDIFHREGFVEEGDDPVLMDSRAAKVVSRGGNDKAVLLVHGFSSNPWLFHKHIPLFEKAGYDVIAPRLPGHGTSPEAFMKSSFTQYYKCVEETLKTYRHEYSQLHVVGISMGGLLTLKLAEEHSTGSYAPDSITTLAAPVKLSDPRLWLVRMLSWIKPRMTGEWDPVRESDGGECWLGYNDLFLPQAYSIAMAMIRIRPRLKEITLPHLLIHAKGDKDAPFENVWEIASSTSSAHQEVWVPDLSEWDHSRHSLFLYNSQIEPLSNRILSFHRAVAAGCPGETAGAKGCIPAGRLE